LEAYITEKCAAYLVDCIKNLVVRFSLVSAALKRLKIRFKKAASGFANETKESEMNLIKKFPKFPSIPIIYGCKTGVNKQLEQ
jgi:hypothetical protein